MIHEIEENDIVLCTVKRIEGTTVFLDVVDFPGTQATMIFSEVSPYIFLNPLSLFLFHILMCYLL